jgi:hypothetical protein
MTYRAAVTSCKIDAEVASPKDSTDVIVNPVTSPQSMLSNDTDHPEL